MADKPDKVTKWTGKPIVTMAGIRFHIKERKPKTEVGKRRMVVNIRQDKPKRWRVDQVLSYGNSVDLRFVEIEE